MIALKASTPVVLSLLLAAGPALARTEGTSCTACHSDAAHVGDLAAIVEQYEADVHAEVGLSCHDCHGGDPAAADKQSAKRPEVYRGAPARAEIPGFCGRCHSSPAYMKRFRPDARVDQQREYWSSQHGKLLREGDPKVATCVDCHGVHGIRRPSDPQSSVYPSHVAETCRHCHADAAYMGGYKLPDGRPLPVDQYERWSRSVHAAALLEKEDLSAPTCNDCHGNHGATPPGLQSVGFVCGQCHGREADLFRNSPKKEGFERHNQILEAIGPTDGSPCATCHASEPPESIETVHRFGECTTCHGNHAVIRPTMAMLGPLPTTPCEFCHSSAAASEGQLLESSGQERFERVREDLLAAADRDGLQGDELFDWLVDQARRLPVHTEDSRAADGSAAMKPEFQRLFEKFRIGTTHFTYIDPVTGEPVKQSIIRCTSCHGATVDGDDGKPQPSASAIFLERMKELTVHIARAERMILRAHRGGVSTTAAAASLDEAVDAQIELEVLVHSFTTEEGGAFAQTAATGFEETYKATELAHQALGELAYRRKGLAASLVVILLVLIGLGLKIRELARRRAEDAGP